jgi:hypothetical protein
VGGESNAKGRDEKAGKMLSEKSEAKRPLGSYMRRRQDNIKLIRRCGVESCGL